MSLTDVRPQQRGAEHQKMSNRPVTRRRRVHTAPRGRGFRVASRHVETAQLISTAATMVALVCLWVLAQMLWFSAISQNRAQDLLYDQWRTELASATAPVGPGAAPGDPVALLRIPALGVEQVVVEGTASGDLQAGPGHLRNTVLPGQQGTSVVTGRAATYGAPFADLGALTVGEKILTATGQGEQTFTVTGVRRAGDPLPAGLPTGAARLTLVTAEGSGLLSRLRPSRALYIDAQTTQGFEFPGNVPVAVPAGEKPMASETAALPLAVLHLALLLGGVLLVVLARTRWSARLVWVVASPLVLALAWSTTDVVTRLLPNLT